MRALFGLSSSAFLLGGVIKQHLENCRKAYQEIVKEIEKSLYVDNLINGGPTVEAARQVKETSTKVCDSRSICRSPRSDRRV